MPATILVIVVELDELRRDGCSTGDDCNTLTACGVTLAAVASDLEKASPKSLLNASKKTRHTASASTAKGSNKGGGVVDEKELGGSEVKLVLAIVLSVVLRLVV